MTNNREKSFYYTLLKEMIDNEKNKSSNGLSYKEILIKNKIPIIDLYYNNKTGIWQKAFSE